MSDRVRTRLTDDLVGRIALYNECNVDGWLAVLLAREVLASRKLIADLRALHASTGPTAQCGECWADEPCPTIRLIDKAGL